MSVLEFVARTFSPQLPDGRFIFRPWGPIGPCYLLTRQQRNARAWVQLAYYALGLAVLTLTDVALSTSTMVVFAVIFTLVNYTLFWLFTVGLPKTDKPLPLTPAQRRAAMTAHPRALGRPFLWVLAAIAWSFTLAGGAMALFLGDWVTGSLCFIFFGMCGAIFTYQLRLARRKSGA